MPDDAVENNVHHEVYVRDYDDAYYGNPYVRRYAETVREEDLQALLFGEWDISDYEDEPEIKATERGGALDEFLYRFKPQEITPKKEVINQDEC